MLMPAKLYEKPLQDAIALTAIDLFYQYWLHARYAKTTITIEDDFWGSMQFVSVLGDKIIGYLNASMKRPENSVESISLINFDKTGETKMVFANDIKRFFKYLVDISKVKKINWQVYSGNPATAQYERWAKAIGAFKVGTFKKDILINGTYKDTTHYEWINDYFECTHCGHRNKFEAEVMCCKCGVGEMIYHNPFGG